jgi:hypothetical protein
VTRPKSRLPTQYRPGPTMKRHCFYNAFEHVRMNGDLWRAVHAIVTPSFTEVPGPVGHAWTEVEHDGETWAWDPSTNSWARAANYRKHLCAGYAVVYTLDELLAHATRDGHSGPWDDALLAAGYARREGRRIAVEQPLIAGQVEETSND